MRHPALRITQARLARRHSLRPTLTLSLRRQQAYARYSALDDQSVGPVVGAYSPGEREQWDIIDEAEEAIRSAVATTPRGAMIQLWCALNHSVTDREIDAAVREGDLVSLEKHDGSLDWSERLMLATLRSLNSMEA